MSNSGTFLLINNNIRDRDKLIKSVKNDYLSIDNFDTINDIDTFFIENNRILINLSYFAFLYDNNNIHMSFFQNDNEYFGDLFSYFVTKLVSLNNSIIIDIITCNINKDSQKEKIAILETNLNINIRYSLNKTGDYNQGGDWLMESDNINIKDIYFNENINDWNHTLWVQSYSSALYRYIIDVSGNRIYTHHDISGNEINPIYDSSGYNIKYKSGKIVLTGLVSAIPPSIIPQLQSGCVAIQSTQTSIENAFAVLKDDGSVVVWGPATNGGILSASVSAQLRSNVIAIYSTAFAFAALKNDGSVIVWGNSLYGGDSTSVSAQLRSNVRMIYAGNNAFYALKTDGSVVVWGDTAVLTNINTVSTQIQSNVRTIYVTTGGCAILKDTGSVLCLGNTTNIASFNTVSAQLQSGVISIYTTFDGAYAALKQAGNIVTWGNSAGGGNMSSISAQLQSNIKMVYANQFAFAVLKTTGQVITWGTSSLGGSMTTPNNVSGSLQSNVMAIYSSLTMFAALRSDGTVVSWGENNGYATGITNTKAIYSTTIGFASLRNNNTVAAWGATNFGGNSSSVSSRLFNVRNIYSNNNSFIAHKTDNSIVSWGGQPQLPTFNNNNYRAITATNEGYVAIGDANYSYQSTLILKLDASIISGINNAAISSWVSPVIGTSPTYTASSSSSSFFPTLKTNALNGMSIVQYLSASNQRQTINSFILNNPLYCTIFVLYSIPVGYTGNLFMELNSVDTQPGFNINSASNSYGNICPVADSPYTIGLAGSLAPTPGTWGLQCLVSADPANYFYETSYMNGSLITSNSTDMRTLTSASVTSTLNINCRNNTSLISNINIAEIRIFNSALDQSDRQAVEAEIMWKWGLQNQLPISHPYYNTNRSNVIILGTPYKNQILTCMPTISDSLSGIFNYTWSQGSTSSTINTTISTTSSVLLSLPQVNKFIQVTVSYSDNDNISQSVQSNIIGPIGFVNSLPTIIISGTLTENSILTATVSDVDIIVTAITYQWSECTTFNGTYTNIMGATSQTYQLAHSQVSRYIKVTVNYIDSYSNVELATSDFVGPIANVTNTITGNAVIYGTLLQGNNLTVSNTLTSLDGLLFTYRWFQSTTSGGVYTQI